MRNERNVKKVLLVEDELDINLVFKTVLEYSGFEVDAFNGPLLALQNFVTNSYESVTFRYSNAKNEWFSSVSNDKEDRR